jgi:hypothetical protein
VHQPRRLLHQCSQEAHRGTIICLNLSSLGTQASARPVSYSGSQRTASLSVTCQPSVRIDKVVIVNHSIGIDFKIKKINLRDVSLVVPRINWESGTVYDQWDGDYGANFPSNSGATDVIAANFYVLTSTFNVYKCIFNNKINPSTVCDVSLCDLMLECDLQGPINQAHQNNSLCRP